MARRELRGEGTARGAALGTARVVYPLDFAVVSDPVARHEVPAELARVDAAIGRARAELDQVRRRLRGPLKREIGEFVDAHALILDDAEFADGIRAGIVEHRLNAEAALKAHRDQLVEAFEAIDDPYLRSRGEDIEQVVARVFAALKRGRPEPRRARAASGGVVLVAESVAPDEIETWQQEGLVALVVTRASVWSHATILARALRVPMVVADPGIFDAIRDGDPVLVDADGGLVIAGPDTLDLSRLRERQREQERSARARARLRTADTRTRDGLAIRLWANAEHEDDLALARRLGATGIGLYRTEFLYAAHADGGDEETQFRAYRDAVLAMGGRPVTLRTLDAGGDKGGGSGRVPAARIPRWACADCGCHWHSPRPSRPSSAQCCAPRPTDRSASCSRWSPASTRRHARGRSSKPAAPSSTSPGSASAKSRSARWSKCPPPRWCRTGSPRPSTSLRWAPTTSSSTRSPRTATTLPSRPATTRCIPRSSRWSR